MQPEVIYCGFTRISPISREHLYQTAQSNTTSQEIVLTVSIIGPKRYNFTTAIHKQADIQTLARTVETLLSDRKVIVACLIDLGSDNPLRWSDTVDDVLDGDSVVGVIPLSEATLVRTMQLSQVNDLSTRPPVQRSQTAFSRESVKSVSAPLPQLEFMHITPEKPQLETRRDSIYGSVNSPGAESTYYIDTALVRRRSDMQKPALRALRILRPSSAARTSEIPAVEPFASTYIPPLPSSPIPKAIQTPLSQICSNSIALLAFFRYCARKKTLCELLYWLDTSSDLINEDYIDRIYLSNEAPLKLNIPREVSTTIEARELLRDGILAYSETGYARAPEGLRVQQIQSESEDLFKQAAITLAGSVKDERKDFVNLLAKALDPENTSILSLKERKSQDTRHALLKQVCGQYFPGEQVDTTNYFDYDEEHLTKPERLRLAHRRTIYAGLFDKRVPSMQSSHLSSRQHNSPRASLLSRQNSVSHRRTTSLRSSAQVGDLMPMEDADVDGWTDVAGERHESKKDTTMPGTPADSSFTQGSAPHGDSTGQPANSNIGASISSLPAARQRRGSIVSSADSEDNQLVSATNATELRKADLVRRQQKLRNILGASPQAVLDKQNSPQIAGDMSSFGVAGPSSPTPSNMSRFTSASNASRMSLSRAEQAEEDDRRSQLRRAAKLYAMFGEHADSPNSVPSYRQKLRSTKSSQSMHYRPLSAASQYDAPTTRSVSRASFTSQQIYEPSSSARGSDSRYMPDRSSGGRKTFRSFMMKKNPKDSPGTSDLLSDFPTPPSATVSPTSPAFRHNFTKHHQFGGSLYGDDESIMEELGSDDEDEEGDPEGEAIVADVRTNAKLRHLLGTDAPTSTVK